MCYPMKQVYIFRRGQPLDLEVRESPDVVPLPHHGMKPTIEMIFLKAVFTRSIGEELRTRHPEVLSRSVYRHDDSLESLGEADLIEQPANLLRGCLIFAQRLRAPRIEIRDDLVVIREAAHKVGQSRCCSNKIGIQSEGGYNDDTPALIIISGFDDGVPVYRRGFEVLQRTNTIVAVSERLKHEETYLGS